MQVNQYISQSTRVHKKLAQQHKELIKVLDRVQVHAKTQKSQKTQAFCILDLHTFEKISNLANCMYENDRTLGKILNGLQLAKNDQFSQILNLQAQIQNLKASTIFIKQDLKTESIEISKVLIRVRSILKEFRERCKNELIDFLGDLDIAIRKILKPLVPSKVLDENIKFSRINNSESLKSNSSTQKSPPASQVVLKKNHQKISDSDSNRSNDEKVQTHMSMLVTTLETVAKHLIILLNDINRKYYEYSDPAFIDSDPPTPLAAPLPEYFSYAAKDLDGIKGETGVIDQEAKNRLIKKLIEIQNQKTQGVITPEKAHRLRLKLQALQNEKLTNNQFESIFSEVNINISEREQLIYDIIDSGRPGERDVTLNEILQGGQSKGRKTNKQKSFEVSGSQYSHAMQSIHGRELSEPVVESELELNSLESSIDDKLEMYLPRPIRISGQFKVMTPTPEMNESKSFQISKPESEALLKKRKSLPPIQKFNKKANGHRKSNPDLKRAITPSIVRKVSPTRKLKLIKRRKSIGK